ncbi:MAG: hypothetical protein JWN71_2146 [Xanthobacteraceae bacterium]|jgi:endogenous inhibitor of DNA gyrase (YacG/DUF329 family)|nr:hypothetical protein [Xanthobacteraceae bacterium]
MSLIMIRCPTTGQAAWTGIETEFATFRRLPAVKSGVFCPVCGREHVWSRKNAWLADDPTPTMPPKQRNLA